MSAVGPNDTPPRPSVFLSYASEDRQAAQVIRDALPGLGLDVWYDESALDGGDAWDQKIRRQIRECDFFMPVISAQTQVRHEGYFRREWRLAVERTLDMADDHIFLLPVVIDDTPEGGARVPEKFLAVQWSRLPAGEPTSAFEALCRRLAAGQRFVGRPVGAPAQRKTPGGSAEATATRTAPQREFPEFPNEQPGQRTRFAGQVALWGLHSGWIAFNRFPKWIRMIIYVWVFIAVFLRGCSSSNEDRPSRSHRVTKADAQKLQEIAKSYEDSADKQDVGKLVGAIAQAFPGRPGKVPPADKPLLAIPFSAAGGDVVGKKLADSVFAETYGRVSISHHGMVGLAAGPGVSPDNDSALQLGRAQHSKYVLYGVVGDPSAAQTLDVRLIEVDDGSVTWSGSFPVAGASPSAIASEVDEKVPDLDDD
jgi:hypothetical protein